MTIGRLAILLVLSTFASVVHADYVLSDSTEVEPLEMFQECGDCPEMIVLPLGEFLMGGPPGESKQNVKFDEAGNWIRVTPENPYIAFQEGPVHKVTIDMPVAMGRNEITYDQWMTCVNDGGCGGHEPQDFIRLPKSQRAKTIGKHPVITVSYLDAVSYTDWLNSKVGMDVYRLPTEVEWEYAARAGTQTPFAQGEEVTTDQVNFLGSATEIMLGEVFPDLVARGTPVPVDALDAANAWGLRHMSGNVAERTMSCWKDRYAGWRTSSIYLKKAREPNCERRVTRGGAYPAAMDGSRVAGRGSGLEDTRSRVSGFRVLRALK
ncbi:formylglycine-generating enzyme family protein [Ruegeria meonggei]|uniref:Serine/threonine-protein kinase pkn1 n=1 Tax=Ruegeria meonggei TaxID=1446476 RepID=A0A1X6YAT0_9RHOB|nr:formylglycine-generating enzyme family protein [Ruegeria meonggei]SLN15219.1 Serine/threonine-protein kinase pkn1 [Ruegeria meonggei]